MVEGQEQDKSAPFARARNYLVALGALIVAVGGVLAALAGVFGNVEQIAGRIASMAGRIGLQETREPPQPAPQPGPAPASVPPPRAGSPPPPPLAREYEVIPLLDRVAARVHRLDVAPDGKRTAVRIELRIFRTGEDASSVSLPEASPLRLQVDGVLIVPKNATSLRYVRLWRADQEEWHSADCEVRRPHDSMLLRLGWEGSSITWRRLRPAS